MIKLISTLTFFRRDIFTGAVPLSVHVVETNHDTEEQVQRTMDVISAPYGIMINAHMTEYEATTGVSVNIIHTKLELGPQ